MKLDNRLLEMSETVMSQDRKIHRLMKMNELLTEEVGELKAALEEAQSSKSNVSVKE